VVGWDQSAREVGPPLVWAISVGKPQKGSRTC
jgi:hypothetical protein